MSKHRPRSTRSIISFGATAALGLLLSSTAVAQTTQVQQLSGTGTDDTVDWEFMVSGGRQSGAWHTIPVPSNWEMQGFGTYRYYDDWSTDPAPDSVGNYRHRFTVPSDWADRKVDIVFGGSMTDTEVTINGRLAGTVHRGGFYQFRYDVTDLLEFGGPNVLEATVRKFSSNTSINRAERQADYWLFGGIFRPVWLEARPPQHIDRTAVDARHSGEFAIDVVLDGITSADRVTAQIQRLGGAAVGAAFSGAIEPGRESVTLRTRAENVQPWSPEWPNRYRVHVRLEVEGATLHEVTETFGFRTVEVRPKDGLYVNGVKVRLKGVNRHSFWPTSGCTTSKALSIQDVQLMKDMNMNAVRMSHYPPDAHFLDAADSLGLFVIDELAGWQAAYDAGVGAPLVREFVVRDVNHPSIILWANGNEGGWNTELDDDFGLYDPQHRTVIHPWLTHGGINTSHYEVYDCCTGWFFHGDDLMLPTEFLHGLYDGGHGAGLEDWWNLMLDTPLAVGGFLWAFADEGIVRDDQDGRIDVAGNSAPDGIVGPYREKEGSFYTIKEVWSPIYFPWSEVDRLPPSFDGRLRVENRYDFTDLSQVRFDWRLVDFPSPAKATGGSQGSASRIAPAVAIDGTAPSPAVAPHAVDTLALPLPDDWHRHDALYLTATDPHGREIYTWSSMISEPDALAERLVTNETIRAIGTERVAGSAANGAVSMQTEGIEIRIDMATGRLDGVRREGVAVSLRNGPRLVSEESTLESITHRADGYAYEVEATYAGILQRVRWRLRPSGWLQLDYVYRYSQDAAEEYLGVTFDYPDEHAEGVRWLGRGPYRVWKNRLKGNAFGVWQKEYNDAITGTQWIYPEFKGFHSDVHWAVLETSELPITMAFASEDLFLRLFTPSEAPDPRTTHVDFPPGDLSFLHGIAPIGTKFHPPEAHGPMGRPNLVRRHGSTKE